MSHCRLSIMVAIIGTMLAQSAATYAGRKAPVPPSRELEILDPGVDPLGQPTVVTRPAPGGPTQVTIPPTVIVHKYYYTGDRKFQGPMLPGGPTIIVVKHPKTGEQCHLEINMLPGAPKIVYTDHAIDYDYGKQHITLRFPCCGSPKVVYRK